LPDAHVLTAVNTSPLYMKALRENFVVHERVHETDPQAFAAAAPRIRAFAGGGESKIGAALIAKLPALEVISIMGVGYDGVDVAAAKARGIMVTHTPDVLNDDVADLALGLMLCAARQLPAADRFVRAGDWDKGAMPLQRKMSGARLGLVGIGRIGQAIAQRALGFSMSVAYTARSRRDELPYAYYPTPTELAVHSDFLVVITPGGAATRKLIDRNVLQALGNKGILVNVSRGSVVDEAALVESLEQGIIGGAALDVFESEPKVPQRLKDLPHVVLTPHVGSATGQTRQAMADLAMRNLLAHFAGQPLATPVPECRS
jgi:hydroxypyruvate reductase